MYIPKIHKHINDAEVKAFIQQNGFGILVSQLAGKSLATHIPLVLSKNKKGKDILQSHISITNPQKEHFKKNAEVLCIFNGPHSYISSSWYDHENVPTWNYIAVHVYGKIKILEGEALYNSIKDLVDEYEINSEKPVRVEEFSKKTLREMRGVVGIEIEITDIQAARKLSQNRDDKNYKNIISELNKTNNIASKAIASEMIKERKL